MYNIKATTLTVFHLGSLHLPSTRPRSVPDSRQSRDESACDRDYLKLFGVDQEHFSNPSASFRKWSKSNRHWNFKCCRVWTLILSFGNPSGRSESDLKLFRMIGKWSGSIRRGFGKPSASHDHPCIVYFYIHHGRYDLFALIYIGCYCVRLSHVSFPIISVIFVI